MTVTLKLSRRMLNNIRQQLENRIENIYGFNATGDRMYRAELQRLRRQVRALNSARPLPRRRK
jgi:hypothetical protein